MGIWDKPTAPAPPWQNGFLERLIESIRRECVDHIIGLGEMHLPRVLKSYADHCNCVRTHRSLKKDGAGFSPGSANWCEQFTRHPWTANRLEMPEGCRPRRSQYCMFRTPSFGGFWLPVGGLEMISARERAEVTSCPPKLNRSVDFSHRG
jgi:hypothetical protein